MHRPPGVAYQVRPPTLDTPLPPDAVWNTSVAKKAAPCAGDKTHTAPAPSTAPLALGQEGKPRNRDAEERDPPTGNMNEHERTHHPYAGRRNHPPTAAPSVMQPGAPTEKQQKHVDHPESPSQQSDNSRQPSTKQDKPLQPPPTVAHQDEHSERSPASPIENKASQPSNAAADEGKGGGERKKDKAAVKRSPTRRKRKVTTERSFKDSLKRRKKFPLPSKPRTAAVAAPPGWRAALRPHPRAAPPSSPTAGAGR